MKIHWDLLNMHFVKLPKYADYWNQSSPLSSVPLVSENMTKTRFREILNNIHFSDVEKYQSDKKIS